MKKRYRLQRGEGTAWIASQQGKHFCQCGCGGAIPIQIHHSARGIPRYLDGHYSRIKNPMSGRSGKLNPHYNKGRYVNLEGYVLILIPGPGRSKYELEHRMVMEKALGRKLKRNEVVHHKNRNKLDNRLDNLELMTHSGHSSHHARKGETGFGVWKGKNARVPDSSR